MTESTLTYHGNVAEKRATLKQLRQHRQADQIVQGTYWSGNGEGRGCAVGCLTHNPNGGHDEFPDRWGIPVQIAYLVDSLFESLPVEEAVDWPVRFMSAVPVGADLSRVWDQWCVWMLRRLIAKSPVTLDSSVEVMAVLFEAAARGDEPAEADWAGAAEAAEAAGAAGAARAAGAAWAAEAAWAAGAAGAAEAAWAARAAEAAARHDWARDAAAELVRLVKKA